MKRIRLEREAYRLGHCFSVAVATAERAPALTEPEIIPICMGAMQEAAEKYAANVYAYCFMPDHVHLLASTPRGVSFVDFIRHFKQLSAYRLRRLRHTAGPAWQTRFYDHALRSDEDVVAAARYVFENPVRAGLVADARDYQYSGSFVWEGVPYASGSEDPDLHPDLHSARRRVAFPPEADAPLAQAARSVSSGSEACPEQGRKDPDLHRRTTAVERDQKEDLPWT